MTAEEALRKVVLLRKVSTNNGAAAAEVENARRLQQALMKRYAIKARDVRTASATTVFRMTWVCWEQLLKEFRLRLDRFGNRGSATIRDDTKIYIRLDRNQWWIEERLPGGWQPTARSLGVESLRKYLSERAPRSYMLFRR